MGWVACALSIVYLELQVRGNLGVTKLREEEKKECVLREHEKLKLELGGFAQQNGFRVMSEEQTDSGGRIDLALHRKDINIACEVSVKNSASYELENIKKCLDAGFAQVCLVSPVVSHLKNIEQRVKKDFTKSDATKIHFLLPVDFPSYIQGFERKVEPKEKIIKGYRVKLKYSKTDHHSMEEAKQAIAKTLLERSKQEGGEKE